MLFESAGPFISNAPGQTRSGYTLQGTGWYRKHFNYDTSNDKKSSIFFGGVMMNSDVWLNGNHLGFHPYGYTSFYYNLTPYLKDGENTLSVRVRNDGVTSRWYPGSGIYRNVWFPETSSTHIRPWGVWAKTLSANDDKAVIEVDIELDGLVENTNLKIYVLNENEKIVVESEKQAMDSLTAFKLEIKNPKLWDIDTPNLYTVRVQVLKNNKVIDEYDQSFGIRTISFSSEKGFLLNGRMVNMIGGCVHHDNGLLGAKAPARADIRKMEIMKQEGYNAVRASHNPMSDAFYDACDRIGLLVMDEIFDVWGVHKTPQDYSAEAWYKGRAKDIENWCRRTRNHPSIVIRSLGNEIGNREKHNVLLEDLKELLTIAKGFDNTRPYTGGSARIADNTDYMKLYDVPGYNYREDIAYANHIKFPDWVVIGTESNPTPSEHMTSVNFVREHNWFTGCFVWSAFEYIGESWCGWTGTNLETKGSWPSFAAGCGMIDITGFPKGGQVFRRVAMEVSPIEINVLQPLPKGQKWMSEAWSWPNEFPYWGWEGFERDTLEVKVITNEPSVRLKLNNKVIGVQNVDSLNINTVFKIPYQPGTIVAEGLNKDGNVICSKKLVTPGKAAEIKIVPDRESITNHNNDLAYVCLEVLDANGRLVMHDRYDLSVSIEGPAEIIGCGSGSHKDVYSFGNPEAIKTWRGRAMVILRPTGETGKVKVVSESETFGRTEFELPITFK